MTTTPVNHEVPPQPGLLIERKKIIGDAEPTCSDRFELPVPPPRAAG